MSDFKNVTLIKHPVIDRDMTILRDKRTNHALFRRVLGRISVILAYHALEDLPLKSKQIETPIEETEGYTLDTEVIAIPILRAGLSMVDAIVQFIPDVKIGHLGMYRDEDTHQPVDYYNNLPSGIEDALVLLVDPMLATGGSANDAITFVKNNGAANLKFVSLISAPEGLERIEQDHPDVPIITASVDRELNDDAFIVPGLGDAGDRYFGTT